MSILTDFANAIDWLWGWIWWISYMQFKILMYVLAFTAVAIALGMIFEGAKKLFDYMRGY